jgi:hypothetical protein
MGGRITRGVRKSGSAWARSTATRARSAINRRRYPLPLLRTQATRTRAPRVFYCLADYDVPSGGVRVAYRHVDLLNRAGISAAVLHRRPGFRCTWFDHKTEIAYSRDTVIEPDDIVVVGELWVSLLERLSPGFRFVVFNQNAHLTWQRASPATVKKYSTSPDLGAIVTVSDHGVRMLEQVSPRARVLRTHNSIDPLLFYVGLEPRDRTIVYMPRRGRREAEQVLGMLEARGVLEGWNVLAIHGLSERDVANELRRATVFLSFAYQEGFGLPAAEAMACGAYVVGFHGFGGEEFFRPEFSYPIPSGDVVAFARAVEEVLTSEDREPGWCAAHGALAARFIADEYSRERESSDLITAFGPLTSQRQPTRRVSQSV